MKCSAFNKEEESLNKKIFDVKKNFSVKEVYSILFIKHEVCNLCMLHDEKYKNSAINTILRISPRIFVKIRNGPNEILRGPGEIDS
jgi:hypothetical protein